MIYYALGAAAFVFIMMIGTVSYTKRAVSFSDSDELEWDAQGGENLSRSLRARFARF